MTRTTMTTDAPRFAVGDRVRIVGAHPWRGHMGTISEPFRSDSAPDLAWRVSLETSWGDAAVSERDIRHAD
jgi:hypothetical protein